MCIVIILSHFVACLFVFLMVSFDEQTFLVLMMPHLQIFVVNDYFCFKTSL